VREDRRLVTALFVDLRGSTTLAEQHDVEDVRELLRWFTTTAIRVVESFGGVINDLAGDGVLALFGAPTTREDDPERAVRAGLCFQHEMGSIARRATAELGFADVGARVGIETGRVVAGPVGGGGRIEYGVTGDAVNVAARLQALAPVGGVLVGPETVGQVGDRVRWGEPLTLTLKGRTAPVTARLAIALAEADANGSGPPANGSSPDPPLVGRVLELRRVLRAVDDLIAGTGATIAVCGDVGIGKSALVARAAQAAAAGGAEIWRIRCSPWESAAPFAAIRSLIGSTSAWTPGQAAQRPSAFNGCRGCGVPRAPRCGAVRWSSRSMTCSGPTHRRWRRSPS